MHLCSRAEVHGMEELLHTPNFCGETLCSIYSRQCWKCACLHLMKERGKRTIHEARSHVPRSSQDVHARHGTFAKTTFGFRATWRPRRRWKLYRTVRMEAPEAMGLCNLEPQQNVNHMGVLMRQNPDMGA